MILKSFCKIRSIFGVVVLEVDVVVVDAVVVVSPVDADDDEDHGGEVESESAKERKNFASKIPGKPKTKQTPNDLKFFNFITQSVK